MGQTYLEVTYRRGRPIAGYFCLPRRDGDRSSQVECAEGGLVVDFAPDGRPIGIEITSPSRLDLSRFNALLARLGQELVTREDLAPLLAA